MAELYPVSPAVPELEPAAVPRSLTAVPPQPAGLVVLPAVSAPHACRRWRWTVPRSQATQGRGLSSSVAVNLLELSVQKKTRQKRKTKGERERRRRRKERKKKKFGHKVFLSIVTTPLTEEWKGLFLRRDKCTKLYLSTFKGSSFVCKSWEIPINIFRNVMSLIIDHLHHAYWFVKSV